MRREPRSLPRSASLTWQAPPADYAGYPADIYTVSGNAETIHGTVGIDVTARDLQKKASEAGQPWTICKGFDGSAAIGEWIPKEKLFGEDQGQDGMLPGIQRLQFHLDINGKTVQEGCTSDMLYRVDEIIAYISQFFTLKTGDMLYTGTPAGVGPVHIGDHLDGWLEERKVLELNCR